jgi:hypothetical protein
VCYIFFHNSFIAAVGYYHQWPPDLLRLGAWQPTVYVNNVDLAGNYPALSKTANLANRNRDHRQQGHAEVDTITKESEVSPARTSSFPCVQGLHMAAPQRRPIATSGLVTRRPPHGDGITNKSPPRGSSKIRSRILIGGDCGLLCEGGRD